jgi:alpha-mannosidase
MAKFEVCCHKFADLSEYGYGVSILNDSKYGFATVGDVMRLSLLRSPKAPDDTADMGRHHIRWAIMPHRGELGPQTVQAAFNFNNPLKLVNVSDESALTNPPIVLKGDGNLILDTVKRGEDDMDVSVSDLPKRQEISIIIRVYDALGGRGKGTIETTWPLSKVLKTNLLEDDGDGVAFSDGKFEVDLGPFQVCTYRLVLA